MWNSEIQLQKIYRSTGGNPPSDDDEELESALNEFLIPTPSAQSVSEFVQNAGPSTVHSMIDDIIEGKEIPTKRKRPGPLFPSLGVGSSSVADGSSMADGSSSISVPPNIVGTSKYTFKQSELNHKIKETKDNEELKEYLVEYFSHFIENVERKEVSWSLVKTLRSKRIAEIFGYYIYNNINAAVDDISGNTYKEFLKELKKIIYK